MADASDLLERFLNGRTGRTRQAYRLDLEDFARFVGLKPVAAAAHLLAGGPGAAGRVAARYAADLHRRELAPATVTRRLDTLRRLVRLAHEQGMIEWTLERPTDEEGMPAGGAVAGPEVPYLVPPHPREVDRLDLQHYALREAVGVNHLAPVAGPARILDAGCGTGQWGFEMCAELPAAVVVGLDLVAGKPGWPAGYHRVRGNLLEGLPFADERFDFVHQRLLFLAIPLSRWPSVVAELVRVTRPGGWVELVETPFMGFQGGGPAIDGLRALIVSAAAPRGLDIDGAVFRGLDGYLRDAGLMGVNRREFGLPVGEWGGRVGSLMATDCRAGFSRFLDSMEGLPPEEGRELLRRVQQEYEDRRVTSAVAVAFGRKPL